MKPEDHVIAKLAAADPARRLAPSGKALGELSRRVRQQVLDAAATADNRPAGRLSLWSGAASVTLAVASVAVVVAVAALFILAGGARHVAGESNSAQAQRLYAPVAEFLRTTTAQQRSGSDPAAQADVRRGNRCLAPYQNRLFGPSVGTHERGLQTLYQHGTLLASYQARVAQVAPQLARLADAWANLRLANPILGGFAHALAREFDATLQAPRFNGCTFIHALARHNFSIAWATRSSHGRAATRFWNVISTAGNDSSIGEFWQWVYPRGVGAPPQGPFSKAELLELANLPGELS